jgi:ferredoxin
MLDTERCVHAISPLASCRKCIEACPRGALHLGLAMELAASHCDGCGMCAPACPEGAISLSAAPVTLKDESGRVTLWAACSREVPGGDAVLPCLDAIGPRELRAVASYALDRVAVARADCAGCPRLACSGFTKALDRLNVLRHSEGLPAVAVDVLPGPVWRRELDRARKAGTVDPDRRKFLRGFLALAGDGSPARDRAHPRAVYPHAPRIEDGKCTACHACARLCPHGAIAFSQYETGASYTFDAKQCTGCQLCVDVCENGAVSIEEMALAGRTHMALRQGHCAKCGAPFWEPAGQRPASTGQLCWVCARRVGRMPLFQRLP